MELVLVGIGGAAGAIARRVVDVAIMERAGTSFPLGTLVINLSGSFVLGLLFAWAMERDVLPVGVRAPLMIGFLGAYTTFSTWMLESWRLVEDGAWGLAVLNLGGSVLLGLAAVVAGLAVGRQLPLAAVAFDARVLEAVDGWGAPTVAVAVVDPAGPVASLGPMDEPLPWASVTKVVAALTVLVAAERGLVALDEPAGPPGSTVRHLLAHASGLAPEQPLPMSAPERTRIYSNAGFDLLGELVAARAGRPFADVAREAVLEPLGMAGSSLAGPASRGLVGPCRDLASLARELLAPSVLPGAVVRSASTVAYPGLRGVLPGFGLQDPCDWGLGLEVRGSKSPHWTGRANAPATVGHFGRSGTFLWVDPVAGVALACLTDRPFGPWAGEAWPALSDAVLDAYQPNEPGSPLTGPTTRDVSQPP